MDQESLLQQGSSVTPSSGKTPSRHTNLYNSTLGATMVNKKSKGPKFIPREPVKGAVKPITPSGQTSQVLTRKSSGSIGVSTESKTAMGVALKDKPMEVPNYIKPVPFYASTAHLTAKTCESLYVGSRVPSGLQAMGNPQPTLISGSTENSLISGVCESSLIEATQHSKKNSVSVVEQKDPERSGQVHPDGNPEGEREVEGKAGNSGDVSKLEEQLKDMKKNYDVQTKVNT